MIPWLIQFIFDQPDKTPLRLFTFVEFRAVLAILLSCTIVMAFGKRTIRWLVTQKIGDHPEFDNADLNELMRSKANTPTMGGILICGAIGMTTLLMADLADSYYVWMALICLFWLCAIGAIDDWLKLVAKRRHPNSRQGLYSWEKLLAQMGLAIILATFTFRYTDSKYVAEWPDIATMSKALNLPFLKSWVWDNGIQVASPHLWVMPFIVFVGFGVIVIVGSSNAVNLTDGMDGLASGVMVIVGFAFMLLALIAGYHDEVNNFILAKELLVPHIPKTDELAIVAGSMVGACLGFLWFNCSPAQVFMGDSGSLPLGGVLGYIAVAIRQELLLVVIGGIFVLEAVSVIMQVGYFKLTKGKRIFKCAPIHHHFHMAGWAEQQVVVRFVRWSCVLF